MKKKIAILGSTGSIGKTTFNIIKKNKKDFEVTLLTTNKNVNLVIKQARILRVKNIIISSREHYLKAIPPDLPSAANSLTEEKGILYLTLSL